VEEAASEAGVCRTGVESAQREGHAFESSFPRRSRQAVQLNNFNHAASWEFLVFDQDVLSRSNLPRRLIIDTWYQIIIFYIFAAKSARGSIELGKSSYK
jgi:hypothetical protein